MAFRITSVQANPSRGIAGSIDFQFNLRNSEGDRFLLFDARAEVIMRGVPKRGDVRLGTALQTWPQQGQEYARQTGEGALTTSFQLDTALLRARNEITGASGRPMHPHIAARRRPRPPRLP